MKEYEFIKIDTLLVCELEDRKELVYQPEFYSIYNTIKDNMIDDIILLFHLEKENKIHKIKLRTIDKELILEEKINNFDIFDFWYFNFILEKENSNIKIRDKNIEEIIKTYRKFKKGLDTYRYDTIKHKTFHVKQRRISRKQLEAMEMNFKKWSMEEGEDE